MERITDYLLVLIALCSLISCADDTEVGSGLLGSEDIEVVFTDDFDITMTQLSPAPFSYIRSQFHSLGTLDNNTFGQVSSSFYVRPELNSFSTIPEFAESTFDSVVLALKIDTSRYYGNPRALFDIEVLELIESIDDIDTFRTDQEFMTNINPLGSISRLVPGDLDSIAVLDVRGDTTYFDDVITIPLDRRFGAKIFLDTVNNTTPAGFASLLNGFHVKSTSANSLLQVDLFNDVSSLLFYYKDSSGTALNYPYRFSANNPLHFSYDINSSELEMSLEDGASEDIFYLQGHAGATIEIDISDVTKLDNPFVNHASLEFTVQGDSQLDTAFFAVPVAVDLLQKDEEGQLVHVLDLEIGNFNGQVKVLFDGDAVVDEDEGVVRYEMNITSQIKEILKGQQSSNLYLSVRNRVQNPNSTLIFGPNHPVHPARLKLTYTKS